MMNRLGLFLATSEKRIFFKVVISLIFVTWSRMLVGACIEARRTHGSRLRRLQVLAWDEFDGL